MLHTASAIYRRAGGLVLSLLLFLSFAMPIFVQEHGEQSLHTHYFIIYYPAGEQQSAQRYSGFADDFDTAVSGLLGAELAPNLTLHIYATEAAYSAVNPMAALNPGIMSHALPNEGEAGVAAERLRQQPTELPKENTQWL